MATDKTGARHKEASVRRLAAEVLNGGRLDVIDELYSSELAGGSRVWIEPFRASCPGVRTGTIELIAEDDTIVVTSAARPPAAAWKASMKIGIYRLHDARITYAWILENNLTPRSALPAWSPIGCGGCYDDCPPANPVLVAAVLPIDDT